VTKTLCKSRKHDVLLLLGPGQNLLDHRRKIKNDLVCKYGYNRRDIIIMEDIRAKRDDTGIDEKFERILKYYDPMLVIALFHRKARMDGVIFEIGCLCGLYGTRNIGQRLRFLTESGYNFKAMTPYITTLFPKIHSVPFDDSKEYAKPAKLIDVFVATKC
jgi:hypothetical protein